MKYILNPKFKLFGDKNRILLMSDNEDGGEMMFIHPVYAIMFSKFTGENDENLVYKELSTMFDCDESDIVEVIRPFLNNSQRVSIKYDGQTFTFPPKLLIKNRKNIIREDLSSMKYHINPPFDFQTIRLNVPKTLLLVLNTQCYTDCCYCYADKKTAYKPMPTDKILKLIEEAKIVGISNFDLSGGEVLLHKDYDAILSTLLANGFNPFISTKVPISKRKVDRLWEIGIRTIQISLDSVNPDLQENNLNVRMDYVAQIKNTIKELDDKGFDIVIKSTCTKETCTVENIRELIQYIETIKHLKKYTFTPLGYSHYKSLEWYNEHKPTINVLKDIVSMVNEEKKGKYEVMWDFGSIHHKWEYKSSKAFAERAVCTGNVSGFVVLPDGKVTICEELYWNVNFIIGDLMKQSIMEMWQSSEAYNLWNIAQSKINDKSACKTCSIFDFCRYKRGVCWKEIIAFYGKDNWQYPDPRCPQAPELNKDNEMLMYEKI